MAPNGNGSRAKRWCFTLNNWTAPEVQHLSTLVENGSATFLIFGREIGEQGTPHLQGYVEWNAAIRLTTCKNRLGSARFHVEVARGDAAANITYCTKENDFEEFGERPAAGQGRRSDLERFYDWADEFTADNGRPPDTPEIAQQFPTVLTKYRNVPSIVRLRADRVLFFPDPQPRNWQLDLERRLDGPADDRKIFFIVDRDGNRGKSWFAKWYFQNHRQDTQLLSIGKSTDLAHVVRSSTRVFIFDVPRGSMQYLQLQVLEAMKNQWVFSPKYTSMTKTLQHVPHVLVLCNEHPDVCATRMTADRYHYLQIFN